MIKKPKYLKSYENLFLELNPFIESIRAMDFNLNNAEEILLKSNVIAAFTKCYDYNLYNSQSKEYDNSFYRLPMLRGICEDLISLSYLLQKSVKEQTEHIKYMQNSGLHKSLKVQSVFFAEKNPGQITPNPNMISKNTVKQNSCTHSKLPAVWLMAKNAKLTSIYDFLYHATSTMVHFSPDVLMKLGWGEIDNNNNMKNVKFSIKNYNKYYHAFNTFYSWYLLKEQFYAFENYLKIPKTIMKQVKTFDDNFKNSDWPELTTFEHLNIERPSFFEKAIRRGVMNRIINKEGS